MNRGKMSLADVVCSDARKLAREINDDVMAGEDEIADAIMRGFKVHITRAEAAEARLALAIEALTKLVRQVEISNAVDDHGHELKNLKALVVARAALKAAE